MIVLLAEDGGAVTVTIPCEPFAPTVFQFFKQCRECSVYSFSTSLLWITSRPSIADNAPAVFVNSVDANGGVVSKVVSDGDLLDQSWNPTNPAQLFTYSQNVTSLQAVVSNDTFVYGYRMGPTTVTATNAFVPGGPVCGHTVSGQLSYADDTLAGTPANMSVSYQ